MAMDRIFWTPPFTLKSIPAWICPKCNKGTLVPEKDAIKLVESESSKRVRNHEDWEPEWVHGSFGGTLKCSNTKCAEKVLTIGDMNVEMGYEYNPETGEGDPGYYEYLTPMMFAPTIHLFSVHAEVPRNISEAIIDSFKVYWADVSACANKIRNTLELILNFYKVSRTYIEKGKRKNYSLHRRIELFRIEKEYESDHLMAIKWIGNSGSHANDELKTEDILDAYEILEHVLNRLFEKDSIRLKKLSTAINKRRKPNSKKIGKRKRLGGLRK
jgi:hypothetical protein